MCSQNTVRSPMAADLAVALVPDGIFFASAGVREGLVNPFAIEVMGEKDIDISGHEPQAFENLDDTYFDLIITLSAAAHATAMEIKRSQSVEVENWPIADATAVQGRRSIILDAYREVRNDLSARIVARFDVKRL
jgi:protein-tyrosine-phosphatase